MIARIAQEACADFLIRCYSRAYSFSLNSRSTITHRPENPSLPILSVHTARRFASCIRQQVCPIGMNWSSTSRTPVEPGTCPYLILLFGLYAAKHRCMQLALRNHA